MTSPEAAAQIRAVLRIQWLSMKNSLRRRSERLGLVFSILVTAIWYGFWAAGALGLFLFPLFAAPPQLVRAIPLILFFILLYWQGSPLLTASLGASIDLRKMALYPIDVRTLFLVECLLRLVTGLEMLLLLAGLSAGMAVRAPRALPIFLPALALFILFNVLLSAGFRNLLERLLQRRRFREIFLFLVVMASATPQFVFWSGSGDKIAHRADQAFGFLPRALLPSTSLAQAYLGHSTAANWIVLLAWCAAAGGFGYFQFRRSFHFDFAAARTDALRLPQGREIWADRFYRIPGRLLPDPAAALVEKELRYLLRSARFRFLFLMGCSFGVMAWLPFAVRRAGMMVGPFQSSFLTVLSLYGLLLLGQVMFLNSFGLDRSAARYFFWMPVSPLLLLVAKNLAGAAFLVAQVVILAGILLLLRLRVGPLQLAEALVTTAIAALYLCSAGNLTSVLFASGLNPERVSRSGAGRGAQGLIVFLYPVLISPLVAAYFVRFYWHSTRGYVFLLAIAAAGGLALYAATLPLAARLGYLRRERLLEELSRGEGPLVGD